MPKTSGSTRLDRGTFAAPLPATARYHFRGVSRRPCRGAAGAWVGRRPVFLHRNAQSDLVASPYAIVRNAGEKARFEVGVDTEAGMRRLFVEPVADCSEPGPIGAAPAETVVQTQVYVPDVRHVVVLNVRRHV